MKKISAFVLTILAAISMSACSSKAPAGDTSLDDVLSKGEITVAISPDFAPSEFKDPNTGEILGSDVYVAQYVADYLSKKYDKEVNLKIEEMDFKTCQAAVQAGSVDFSVNGFSATEDRKENFYTTSHYGKTRSSATSYQGLLINEKDVDKFTTAESFDGAKIAVQLSSLQDNLISAQLPNGNTVPGSIEKEYVTTITQGALYLADGKVDALATTSETGELLMQNYTGLVMAPFKLDYSSEGTVALVNKKHIALGDAISEAIDDMVANVDWEQIRQEYTDKAADLGVNNG